MSCAGSVSFPRAGTTRERDAAASWPGASAAEHADADDYNLSRKSAVLGLAAYTTRICLGDPRAAAVWIPRLLARIARTRDQRKRGGYATPRI